MALNLHGLSLQSTAVRSNETTSGKPKLKNTQQTGSTHQLVKAIEHKENLRNHHPLQEIKGTWYQKAMWILRQKTVGKNQRNLNEILKNDAGRKNKI